MINFFKNLLVHYGANEDFAFYFSNVIAIVIIAAVCLLVDLISKKVLLKIISFYVSKSKKKWDDIFLKNNVFKYIVHILPVLIIHEAAVFFPQFKVWIQRIAFSCIVILVLMVLNRIVDSVNDIYNQYAVSKTRPIKGYLQVLKIFFFIAVTIIVLSVLIDRSPWVLLSGLGAATAVLLLVFQNSILGLVASIQLATNDMLQIGEWIEMPSNNADGSVIDITLHTVKVQNWDNTIVTIPTHSLISHSFKNWRGMINSGGRRIKRSIYIDMTSIMFCSGEMLAKLKEIEYVREYVETKTAEIEKYNKEHHINPSSIVNGRHMTNIEIFRVYIDNYLRHHPRINQKMTLMVRQLQAGENGLPIEIYAFANTTNWVAYEEIQSEIFDHLLAVVPEFGLKIFQNPTGSDISRLRGAV
jgi:miniconductance mechanosensitive channel